MNTFIPEKSKGKIGVANFTFINTPYLSDKASLNEAEKNEILSRVKNQGGVNCICVVLNGWDSVVSEF